MIDKMHNFSVDHERLYKMSEYIFQATKTNPSAAYIKQILKFAYLKIYLTILNLVTGLASRFSLDTHVQNDSMMEHVSITNASLLDVFFMLMSHNRSISNKRIINIEIFRTHLIRAYVFMWLCEKGIVNSIIT